MKTKKSLAEKGDITDNNYGPLADNARIRAKRDRLVKKGHKIRYYVKKART